MKRLLLIMLCFGWLSSSIGQVTKYKPSVEERLEMGGNYLIKSSNMQAIGITTSILGIGALAIGNYYHREDVNRMGYVLVGVGFVANISSISTKLKAGRWLRGDTVYQTEGRKSTKKRHAAPRYDD